MTEQKKFEILKDDAIKKHALYLDEMKGFSYEDLMNLHKRLKLLQFYAESVISNSAYRDFINKYKNRFLN